MPVSEKMDGGPAFPWPSDDVTSVFGEHLTRGMSLRDWFAGQCLSNLVNWMNAEQAASRAYEFADAMLASRAKLEGDRHDRT